MKPLAILKLDPSQYRVHRFPPMAEQLPVQDTNLTTLMAAEEQFDYQQRFEQGFQQGLTQGHAEGLTQGQEQGYQQGLQQGNQAGFAQGFSQGEQQGRQQFIDAITPVEQLFAQISQWQQQQEQQQRLMICELVQKVSQQVIRAELTLMPQQILALVEETLQSLPGKTEQVNIELNPDDLARLQNLNKELPSNWRLVANNALPIGGCHLSTEDAEADVSCDARLAHCMENVEAHLLQQPASTDLVEE